MAAYCASKAALDHFSRCSCWRSGAGVKVTTLARFRDTGFGGAPRRAQPPRCRLMLRPRTSPCVLDLLRGRPEAHLSRIEMRPARPPSGRDPRAGTAGRMPGAPSCAFQDHHGPDRAAARRVYTLLSILPC